MDLSGFQQLDMVMVCGLPGSGKSHFAATFFKNSGRKRVNRKDIRRMLHEMTTFGTPWSEAEFEESDEALVKHVERKIIEHLFQSGKKILVDNTSVSRTSRKSYLEIARQMHKTVGVIFLHAPVITCLERNRNREDGVPEIVISNLAAETDTPGNDEGFREVLIVEGY